MRKTALLILASLPTFATIPTCIFGGLMGQAFGRRLSLLLVAPIFAASFICQAAAPDVGLFQFGRLLSGIAAGLVSSPASVKMPLCLVCKQKIDTKAIRENSYSISIFSFCMQREMRNFLVFDPI